MRATSLGHAGILIESGASTILCDPWFVPAFFGSWFVFPRNDRLPAEVLAKIESPTHLYISHIHGDHLDEAFLADHVSRDATGRFAEKQTMNQKMRERTTGRKELSKYPTR